MSCSLHPYTFSHAQESLPTPHIDRVLRAYQRGAKKGRKVGGGVWERGEEVTSSSPVDSGAMETTMEGGGYESRLILLERQLSQLLHKTKVSIVLLSLMICTCIYCPLSGSQKERTRYQTTIFSRSDIT